MKIKLLGKEDIPLVFDKSSKYIVVKSLTITKGSINDIDLNVYFHVKDEGSFNFKICDSKDLNLPLQIDMLSKFRRLNDDLKEKIITEIKIYSHSAEGCEFSIDIEVE